MPYSARAFKVMIASPNDVVRERGLIREILAEWNNVNSDSRKIVLLPVGWETHASPAMGDRPQAIINKQVLKDCDLLVGVFWTRIGTATGDYASGTVEEIEEHIKAGKPAMLYFSSAPVHLDSVDNEQFGKLKAFKDSCKTRGYYETYEDFNDFKDKFYRQLQLKLNQDPFFASAGEALASEASLSPPPSIPNLSKEAQALLKEASQDSQGAILHVAHLGGLLVQTNGKGFTEEGNPRSEATWESAIKELETENLIEDQGYKREVFAVTRRGYEISELLNP